MSSSMLEKKSEPTQVSDATKRKFRRAIVAIVTIAIVIAVIWIGRPILRTINPSSEQNALESYQRVIAVEPILRRSYVNKARAEQKSLPSLSSPARPVVAEKTQVEFRRGITRSADVPGKPNEIYPPWTRLIESARARDVVDALPKTEVVLVVDGNSRAHRKAAWYYLSLLRELEVGLDCMVVLQGEQLAIYRRFAGDMTIELRDVRKRVSTLDLIEVARLESPDADGMIFVTNRADPDFSTKQAVEVATNLDLPMTVIETVGRSRVHQAFAALAEATDGTVARVVRSDD